MHTIFGQGCDFVYSQQKIKQRLNYKLPEVAFAGRSNVGKSTIINALMDSKNLVRTAKTPGSTTSINYFNLADILLLIDLPGFGYAKRSKTQAQNISKLLRDYLFSNNRLSLLVLMLDVRRGLDKFSLDLVKSLNKECIDILIVLSKLDKVTQKYSHNLLETIKQNCSDMKCYKGILAVSGTKKIGLENLRNFIITYCLSNEEYRSRMNKKILE